MNISFNSIEELYNRVVPALNSKVNEFKRNNINYIKAEDIWNFLVESRWKNTKGLMLSDIVDDILHTDNNKIDEYVKNKMKDVKREADFDTEII